MLGHETQFKKPCPGEWMLFVDELAEKQELKTELEGHTKKTQTTF